MSSISEDILSFIRDNPAITIEEMMDYLAKDRNSINYQIKKLKEANLIERLGSKKTGQWKIISK